MNEWMMQMDNGNDKTKDINLETKEKEKCKQMKLTNEKNQNFFTNTIWDK